MRISTATRIQFDTLGWERALEMLAESGFDCVDVTLTNMAKDPDDMFLRPDADELCRRIRARAESLGMT